MKTYYNSDVLFVATTSFFNWLKDYLTEYEKKNEVEKAKIYEKEGEILIKVYNLPFKGYDIPTGEIFKISPEEVTLTDACELIHTVLAYAWGIDGNQFKIYRIGQDIEDINVMGNKDSNVFNAYLQVRFMADV